MKINKISKDLIPDNTLQDIKKQKVQEEKYEQNYESEKAQAESSKKDVEEVATLSTNPEELQELLIGLSLTPSLLEKYPGSKNQPEGWKNFIIKTILSNQNTPSEALSDYWRRKLKYEFNERNRSSFYTEGIIGSRPTIELIHNLLSHLKCPSIVIDEFTDIVSENQSLAPMFKELILQITNHPNVTEKALNNLYKISLCSKIPSIVKQIATNPNAPLNAAVNYVISNQDQDVSRVNEIKNAKAIEQVAKINQSVVGFYPVTIEKLLESKSTSTEVLNIISNLRNDIEKNLHNDQTQIDIHMALRADHSHIDDDFSETAGEFLTRIQDEVKTHPNASVNDVISRQKAAIDYYKKYGNRSKYLDKKIKKMLEEFQYDNLTIGFLYENIVNKEKQK